ncbi:MAG: DUF4338 domain-containing protein [Nitrospirae bacterium]|nr:DUF4338 domain-containing protein [Nitrospirota bacterium]
MIRYSGRDFSPDEILQIQTWIREDPTLHRTELSRRICRIFGWTKPNGSLKDMSCRAALLDMERDGRLTLPPLRRQSPTSLPPRPWTIRHPGRTDPGPVDDRPLPRWPDLALRPVGSRLESELWNDFIHRYHYLGHKTLPGAQIRYIAWSGEIPLACLGFGASAWKVAPRDLWIGWSREIREARLSLVVNNARFLIFPWIRTKNLASRLLALAAKRLPKDWENRYGFAPVLLETFVECDRFRGTCYKAANWIHVGKTQGRGKKDVFNQYALPVKDIYLFPLHRRFRQVLTSDPL